MEHTVHYHTCCATPRATGGVRQRRGRVRERRAPTRPRPRIRPADPTTMNTRSRQPSETAEQQADSRPTRPPKQRSPSKGQHAAQQQRTAASPQGLISKIARNANKMTSGFEEGKDQYHPLSNGK